MATIPIRHISTTTGSIGVRRISDLLGGKTMTQPLHRHDFYYILILDNATGSHTIDFVSYPVRGSSVFVLRPGQVHALTLKTGSTGYLIEFTRDFYYPNETSLRQTFQTATHTPAYRPDKTSLNTLLQITDHMFLEYNQAARGCTDVLRACLSILLTTLVRLPAKTQPDATNVYTQQRFDELSALIEEHVVEHKQSTYYATRMNLSAYQLNAITKTITGKTCSAVIDAYIVLEARRHLLATTDTITTVAHNLGYDDVSYFTRFFKKHTGYTPEAFRKKFSGVL